MNPHTPVSSLAPQRPGAARGSPAGGLRRPPLSRLAAAALLAACGPVMALPFIIGTGSTVTAGQTLGLGETGSIALGGALQVGGGTVAVTITGNNATLDNLGSVLQTGTGRAVRANVSVNGLVINNGSSSNATALMRTADADVIQMNQPIGGITVDNYGQMISLNASNGGAQVLDLNAVTSSSTLVINRGTGLIRASEADAIRPGVNGEVRNAGIIESLTTLGSSSDAIDGQNNSGIQVFNLNGGQINGGRSGIAGGQLNAGSAYTMRIENATGGTIRGNNGAGLNFDGFNNLQVVTVINGGLIVGNGVSGDGDGVDVDGPVALTNTGTIRSSNAFSAIAAGVALSEAISVGGGTITNSGLIEGLVAPGNTNAVGRGISLVGNDITAGPNAGQREAIYSNALVTNQSGGVIRGQSDSAILAGGITGSGRTVEIRNEAGAQLVGGGTANAAVRVTSDYVVTFTNSGLIDGSSSGKALQLGSGAGTVIIQGGSASVLGGMDGGTSGLSTLRMTPGASQGFSYAGAISNFQTVVAESGTVTLSGVSSYTGATRVLAGATLRLDGAGRLAAGSTLELQGGLLALLNAAGQSANSFAALSLAGASAIQLGSATLSFAALASVAPGASLALTGYDAANGFAIRFLGDQLANASFQSMLGATTVNGLQATASFDGLYTNIAAVPEPASAALLLAGGLGLAGWRRLKQRR